MKIKVFEEEEKNQKLETYLKQGYHFVFWGIEAECAGYYCTQLDPKNPNLKKKESHIIDDEVGCAHESFASSLRALGPRGRGVLNYDAREGYQIHRFIPDYDPSSMCWKEINFEEEVPEEDLDVKIFEKKSGPKDLRKKVL